MICHFISIIRSRENSFIWANIFSQISSSSPPVASYGSSVDFALAAASRSEMNCFMSSLHFSEWIMDRYGFTLASNKWTVKTICGKSLSSSFLTITFWDKLEAALFNPLHFVCKRFGRFGFKVGSGSGSRIVLPFLLPDLPGDLILASSSVSSSLLISCFSNFLIQRILCLNFITSGTSRGGFSSQ